MRKLGIRIRKLRDAVAHPAIGNVEIFDVESGETIGCFSDCRILFPVRGAVEVEAKFFPAVVDIIAEQNDTHMHINSGERDVIDVTSAAGRGFAQFIGGAIKFDSGVGGPLPKGVPIIVGE